MKILQALLLALIATTVPCLAENPPILTSSYSLSASNSTYTIIPAPSSDSIHILGIDGILVVPAGAQPYVDLGFASQGHNCGNIVTPIHVYPGSTLALPSVTVIPFHVGAIAAGPPATGFCALVEDNALGGNTTYGLTVTTSYEVH